MFGVVTLHYAEKRRNKLMQQLERIKMMFLGSKCILRETNVCGMLLYRCEVMLPADPDDRMISRCMHKAAMQMYCSGIRMVAVHGALPDTQALHSVGIRISNGSGGLYCSVPFLLLQKALKEYAMIPEESHLIVYTLQINRDVYAFCEAAARIVRYITVIGTDLASQVQQKLFDDYGIASHPAVENGIIRGDILICFDEYQNSDTGYKRPIAVQCAILPYRSINMSGIDAAHVVNDASFDAKRYTPFCVGNGNTDTAILSFLLYGGFLRQSDISVKTIRHFDENLEEN